MPPSVKSPSGVKFCLWQSEIRLTYPKGICFAAPNEIALTGGCGVPAGEME